MSEQGFKPSQAVASNAKKGLELRKKFKRGGTEVGVARARDLSNRKNLSLETVKRMVSFFARHENNSKAKGSESTGFWGKISNPSAGWIAWLLWGGDAGKRWSNSIWNKERKEAMSKSTSLVEVRKMQLEEGEELMEAVRKVMEAIRKKGAAMEPPQFLYLVYIGQESEKSFCVVQNSESGKHFKMFITRTEEGKVDLSEPQEVRRTFIPVKQATEKSGEQVKVQTLPPLSVVSSNGELTASSIAQINKVLSNVGEEDQEDTKVLKMEDTNIPSSVWSGSAFNL